MEPEAETVALMDQISHRFEQFTLASKLPQKLPAALTTFVGREEERQDLYWKLLDPDCRLLTILGMGGSGKTRLAVEAARSLLPAFPGGVFLVELGVLDSPHDLLPAIARTLEVRLKRFQEAAKTDGLAQQLFDFLLGKELLLILDSAEMVLEGARGVSDILQNAPGVKVLATSRSRLNLAGEHLMQLGGLPFPDDASPGWEKSPAVQLFEVAARRSNPDFSLTTENASAVIQICRKLQGMPLAILLATAWVSAMPPDKILMEIQGNLDFLAVGWQDMPARQQSLRAAFDYSWGLLWPEEKSVLRMLSIFRQPFTDQLAREITQATAHHLKALLDFSLIQHTGQNRLRLHDLVRQYALDRLIEEPQESLALHHRFANLYLQKLEKWGVEIKSSEQVRFMGEMDLEIENARLAWDWVAGEEPDDRLAGALEGLCTYYDRRGQYQRGESACEFTLGQVEKNVIDRGKVRLWARLAAWQGHFWISLGRTDDGLKRLEQIGQELDQEKWQDLDTGFERALVLFFTLLAKVRIDNPFALDCATRSAELFRRCGETWYTARALVYAGAALESLGRYDEQLHVSQQALELQSSEGDPELIRYIQYVLGCGYIYNGDVERGSQIIEESLQSSSNSEMKDEIARNTISLAVNQIFMGNYREALSYIELAFSIYQELGKPFGDENYVRYHSATWGVGNYRQSLDLWPKITGVYGQSVTFFGGSIYLLQGKGDLAQASLEQSLQAALETTNTRVVGIILALLSLARYMNGEKEQAFRLLHEALEKSITGNAPEMSMSLLAVVYYLLEQGKVELSLEVYEAAVQVPFFGGSAWTHDFLGVRLEQLAKTLPDEVVEAARARGRAHQLPALVGQWADHLPVLPQTSQVFKTCEVYSRPGSIRDLWGLFFCNKFLKIN